jgi:cobaltochelatase CobS
MAKRKLTVKMVQDFSIFKKGEHVQVTADDEVQPKIYMGDNNGSPVYFPRVSAEVVEEKAPLAPDSGVKFTGSSSTNRAPQFDKKTTKVPNTSSLGLSAQELAILKGAAAGRLPSAADDDGPTSNTDFEPEEGITVEEKAKKLKDARLKVARDKLVPPTSPRLKEGQMWLSDLTYGELPKSGVDHIITVNCTSNWGFTRATGKWELEVNKDNPWFDTMAMADIPEIDLNYYWQPDVLECILMGYKLDARILLTGPPGTGKTTALKQYAAWTDHPFMRFNGKDGIEQSSFLGYNWLSEGTMEWKDGLLPIGLVGGYIICIDEVFKIPPGIQMALQSLYEQGGTLILDEKAGSLFEKTVVPNENARLWTTDNVKGTGDNMEMFASTQSQDTSTLDRFSLTTEVGYLRPEVEERMLMNIYGTSPDIQRVVRRLIKFANLVREAYLTGKVALTMSPRGLQASLDIITTQGLREHHAIEYTYVNKIGDDTEKQVVSQFLKTA